MIYSAASTFAIALLLTEAARTLPQPGDASISPASSTGPGSTYLASTPTPSSFPYSSVSSGCPCYSTPMPYPPTDKNDTSYSSGSYPAGSSSSCSCSSSTPYPSSQPSYTSSSSYTSTKEPYPPTTTKPYPYAPPSKPSSNCSTPPKAPSTTLRATYDTTYDNKNGSLNRVACSNGANGLAGRFPTFGDIPSFPFIGGAFDVVWNSPNCGACWSLTNTATGVSITITAVDAAGSGFNIAQEAFVVLNGGQIGQGVADVVATKVSPSVCGL